MKLVHIGFGSAVSAARILSLVSPESSPIKRVVQEARERGMLIDASYGRRTRSVLLMDTDHVILSAIAPEVLAQRIDAEFQAELPALRKLPPDPTAKRLKLNLSAKKRCRLLTNGIFWSIISWKLALANTFSAVPPSMDCSFFWISVSIR